ncbi:MAG: hypothetical protein K2Y26_19360, partial [Gemmatimonadaceae bacterium]|nr:hypothetical protein [Gemmatimonadaceae bacterium]
HNREVGSSSLPPAIVVHNPAVSQAASSVSSWPLLFGGLVVVATSEGVVEGGIVNSSRREQPENR